jgi:hypothetical protein
MLNKIKVYNRKNGEQIDIAKCRFSADLCLWVGDINTPQEQRYFLTKKDPLNVFNKDVKNDTQGWWFCKDYIVMEWDCVITATTNKNAIISISYNYRDEVFDLSADLLINDPSFTIITQQIFKRFGVTVEKIKNTKWVFSTQFTYSTLGEEKYLELLHLINKQRMRNLIKTI